ncbi:DUF4355 domain-containing protein [Corynebacterium sp. zg-331]|uniref:capsid assembly scaffolding protein Gp46 family protein n=1 Tax=unclassified Corynebacterium TaxID=2624378 RepID=UPI0016429E4C|nr:MULTISPECIES: DUF4355 domain-containing protein [unclassified Corynebacterium]MBC3186295.1 DUF4355 domain-containing protein [Corynebacterium sp. zg-331]
MTTETTDAPDAPAPAPASTSDYQPPATQEDLDRIIEARIARERAKYQGHDEYKAKAAKYDEAQEAKKTAEQKATERITALEAELAAERLAGARARIAAEHHLDADLLAGATEEELAAHAEKIAAAIKAAAPAPTAPVVPGEGRGQVSTPHTDWLRNKLSQH